MNAGFEVKDVYRIQDMVRKAQNLSADRVNPDLMFDVEAGILATRMAKSITKADKALRRGNAALAQGQPKIAVVFFVRAGQLGTELW